ncbi:MAG: CHASE2 domain-containing protein [Nitrospirae bacterium]|nr:CHASE2 domain-containing protein [Nitrospirota bacterium]
MKAIAAKIPDWAAGLAVMVFVMLAFFIEWYPFQKLEYLTYDFRSSLRQKKISTPVIIIGIDESSIEKLGRWPWPRTYVAEAVYKLKESEAKTIGVAILYSENERSDGLLAIREIREKIEKDPAALKDPRVVGIHNALEEAEQSLDSDGMFAEVLDTSKNVVLPLSFVLTENVIEDKTPLADFMTKNSVKPPAKGNYLTAQNVLPPIKEFAERAVGLGHLNIVTDGDGIVRREPLFILYKDRLFPSFAFQIALKYLGYGVNEITINKGVKANKKQIPTNERAEMLISYTGKVRSYPYYSFFDVINNKVPASIFKDKIVLIGLTATGLASINTTPLQSNFYGIEIMANVIENILHSNHLARPKWLLFFELFILAVFGAFISFLIPRLKASLSAAITGGVLVLWSIICIYLFYSPGLWIKMFYPISLLFLGYIAIVSKRYFLTERQTEIMEADSIETNKMLGLSFQGQGLLDMAFEKLRKCPVEDNSIKELLYNLGLDFERKRMLNKAQAVYEHILSDGDYKDLAEKVKKLKVAGETMIFGSSRKEGTVIMDNTDTKPTLGRYEVLKELGRGAMGVVFLGKDPKINRDVAIKTLRYEEIDQEQVPEIKNRFFREAEAAGKLSHPNIVRVYDVGEDNDIAYMAMELLDGSDLAKHCTKESKLSFGEVLRVITNVAEALDYAHENGVVHRDIKPANIMLLKNKELRVTDFGIARVMESSKTQTGMVLGTPSYMSPEQIAGRKVDGRSDLFSLGVVFFELLTGERPFRGDSIATLMYNITSTPPTSIKKIDPRIPACIVVIIEKLLQKNAEDRFARGKDLIDEINKCKKTLVKRPAAPPQATPPQSAT